MRYRKHIDALITRELRRPEIDRQAVGVELAVIDDYTYVALPDGAALPEQPSEIAASVETVTLTAQLKDALKAASPHVRLIRRRVHAAIRERYSIEDELQLLRTAPSPEAAAYNAYVEECLSWGRAERAKLGL